MTTVLEDVHLLARHENEILSVMPCELQGLAVTMTRSSMGLWDLRTGCLVSNFSRARVGAVITASALSRDLRTLVMAESDNVSASRQISSKESSIFAGVCVEPTPPSNPVQWRRARCEADLVHAG